MTISEKFLEKIDAEHEDFLEMIDGYDTDEIVNHSGYIAKFQAIYMYLSTKEPLTDEQMAHLIKVPNPIELLADTYNPSEEETHEEFLVVCESVVNDKVYASGCSKKVNELLDRMSDDLETREIAEKPIEDEKDVFEYMLRISANISKHFAESLMQFEKPIEVIQAATRTSPSLRNMVTETISYIENNDIFTLPHQLDHKNILDESRWRHDAIMEITSIIPRPDFKVTMSWIDFFRTLGDDAETFDENPYEAYVGALHQISQEQGDAILQQLYDMEKDTMILENELVEAAKYLADGGDCDKISELAENGYFDSPYEEIKDKIINEEEQVGMNMC